MHDSEESRYIYLELEANASPEAVAELLEAQGIKTRGSRAVVANSAGYIMTRTLASSVWNHETGYETCQGNCPPGHKHREWGQLTEAQQNTFVRLTGEFLDNCRSDELMVHCLLEDEPIFANTALERDSDLG